MNTPNIHDLNPSKCTERYIKINYPEFYDYLVRTYPNLKHTERLYWYYNGITSTPKCHCGNDLKFINFNKGYTQFCSNKCVSSSPLIKEIKKQTLLDHYGTDNPMHSEQIKSKHKQTCLDRYGVDNVFKHEQIKNKIKQTCLDKYGVDHALKCPEIRDKLINTIHSKNIEQDDSLIGYDENGFQIRKCPHPECNKCDSKSYIIPTNIYYDRYRLHSELCTNLCAVGEFNKSSIEHKIIRFLDEYNIKYELHNRSIISPKEIDIYIPSLKIGIECNGIWAHSSINNLYPKEPSYHMNKTKCCSNSGVRLIHIWEDWVIYKWDIIKSILMNKLSLNNHKIYARKCYIKEIDADIFKSFLNTNHIQGECNASIRYGLYYNEELVSVMGFSKSSNMNKKTSEQFELVRFCSKLYTNVIGGANKLFKYFIKNYNPESIVSFSMNDFSDGNIYKILGFEQRNTNLVYWYFEPNTYKRYHRASFTKNSIVKRGWVDKNDSTWTECEIMTKKGYFQIYDSGQTKWVYTCV